MKVALVHELLTMRGGAERVLKVLADMFPDAPIYTLLYDERKLGDWFPRSRIRKSRIQKRGILSYNHHLYLRDFPRATEAWDFSGYDLVISSSSAFAHGIITNGKPKHVCYVHSPARYLWDRTEDVLARAGKGLLGPLKRWHLSRVFHTLRIWDAEVSDRPDTLLAASAHVQRRIELYWRKDSTVVTPPLDDFWLAGNIPVKPAAPGYYLVVSTLRAYKRIDLAIRACNARKVPLKIVGTGPALTSLKSVAGPTVSFVGYKEGQDLRALYAGARATIFPGDEDFGLVPLESLSCGTPVVAYKAGGALETLTPQTAEFFDTPESASLEAAMARLETRTFDPAACRALAARHDRATFEKAIRQAIDGTMDAH